MQKPFGEARLVSQVLILHARRVLGLPRSSARQPGHRFRLRRKAEQRPQFMPHGAISRGKFNGWLADDFIFTLDQTALKVEGLDVAPTNIVLD